MFTAARLKQRSFSASSQTVPHSGGTETGCQPPLVVVAPMSKFHPSLRLTTAHRLIRIQLRAVHGARHARAMSDTTVARTALRRRVAPPPRLSPPKIGASTSD